MTNVDVPRAPRINLTILHDTCFEIHQNEQKVKLEIGNLSSSGFAFVKPDEGLNVKEGDEIKGTLHLQEEQIAIKAEVMHTYENTVGCKFFDLESNFEEKIKNYFFRELEAIKMRELNPKSLKQPKDGQARWFECGEHCSLYFVENNNEMLRFEIIFFGQSVNWSQEKSLKLGAINEAELSFWQRDDIKNKPNKITSEYRELLVTFLRNIEKLDAETKNKLSNIIQKP